LAQRKIVTAAGTDPPRSSAVAEEVHLERWLDMQTHRESLDVEGKSNIAAFQY